MTSIGTVRSSHRPLGSLEPNQAKIRITSFSSEKASESRTSTGMVRSSRQFCVFKHLILCAVLVLFVRQTAASAPGTWGHQKKEDECKYCQIRKPAPGLTKSGNRFDTCCRECAKGYGYHSPSCEKIFL